MNALMMLRVIVLGFAACVVLPLNALAGEAAAWSSHIKPAPEESGKFVELNLMLDVSEPWHVYGRTGGAQGQAGLELKLKLPAGVEALGEWTWPKPETFHEGRPIEIYTGQQIFTRKLKVTTATGEVKIRITISYQACTHELCGPPEEEEVTATLKITEGKPKPSTKQTQ